MKNAASRENERDDKFPRSRRGSMGEGGERERVGSAEKRDREDSEDGESPRRAFWAR